MLVEAPKVKEVVPGVCRECGCTDDRPCRILDAPCSWVDDPPTRCSACFVDAAPFASRNGTRYQ
jgi:hypothetical protein